MIVYPRRSFVTIERVPVGEMVQYAKASPWVLKLRRVDGELVTLAAGKRSVLAGMVVTVVRRLEEFQQARGILAKARAALSMPSWGWWWCRKMEIGRPVIAVRPDKKLVS